MQSTLSRNIGEMTARIRAHTDLPVAVGFGISNPEQARSVAQCAEAIVVGSAVVNEIATRGKALDLVAGVSDFTKQLVDAVKSL